MTKGMLLGFIFKWFPIVISSISLGMSIKTYQHQHGKKLTKLVELSERDGFDLQDVGVFGYNEIDINFYNPTQEPRNICIRFAYITNRRFGIWSRIKVSWVFRRVSKCKSEADRLRNSKKPNLLGRIYRSVFSKPHFAEYTSLVDPIKCRLELQHNIKRYKEIKPNGFAEFKLDVMHVANELKYWVILNGRQSRIPKRLHMDIVIASPDGYKAVKRITFTTYKDDGLMGDFLYEHFHREGTLGSTLTDRPKTA